MLYAVVCVLLFASYSSVYAQQYACNETGDCLSCLALHGCVFWVCDHDSAFTNVSRCQRISEAEPTLLCIDGGVVLRKIDNQMSCSLKEDKDSTNRYHTVIIVIIIISFLLPVLYGICKCFCGQRENGYESID